MKTTALLAVFRARREPRVTVSRFDPPLRGDSDPLVVRGVESVILLSEVFFDALLLKVMNFLQLVFRYEKFCR